MTSPHPTPPAVLHGLANADYHGGPGLSHSGLKRLRTQTPYHFRQLDQAHGAPPKAPTPAMFNGTLAHCALLEPAEFDKRYLVVVDGLDKRTKEYKQYAEIARSGNCELVTESQRDAAFRQADALRALPEVAELLTLGQPEVSAYWCDPATNTLCKCRPDWVSPVGYGRGAVLLDVKTTADADADQFARSVHTFGYHTQADFYCTGYELAAGVRVHGMVFAVVESEFPHAARVFMLSDAALARAAELNRAALNRYAACLASDTWPGYAPGITVLDLPKWA